MFSNLLYFVLHGPQVYTCKGQFCIFSLISAACKANKYISYSEVSCLLFIPFVIQYVSHGKAKGIT